ncbi:hypothetical protein Kisp01_37070 [Kineosporia sp. NBRC 101677]|uniref:hypothetical protein n=1 Tax=Kineosporia sp. NBRC 101677 TaxID=3032197 RepID=UPI0024A4BF7A|nr:hypothetical protein [Kineosporia sp. NBRC 101677]GLY16692.1 hypothetical protein Kisp01_37070 [Kineosporia sp. NBRC 101677]
MRKELRLLLVLGLLLVGVAAPATGAQAGTTCAYPFRSETENRLSSGNYVMVARNWCGSGTRRLINTPPCGSEDQVKFLSSGQDTPFAQDWDTFRVEVGCQVTMKLTTTCPSRTGTT